MLENISFKFMRDISVFGVCVVECEGSQVASCWKFRSFFKLLTARRDRTARRRSLSKGNEKLDVISSGN